MVICGIIGLILFLSSVTLVFGIGFETMDMCLVGKCVAVIFALISEDNSNSPHLGSGGSGGVFTPALFIGP